MANKIKKLRDKKPYFNKLNAHKKKTKTKGWKKPKGRHGRIKKLLGHDKGSAPNIGRSMPICLRGVRLSGLREKLVHNKEDLKKINPETHGAKIANVGKKKKIEIVENALNMKLKILNLRKPEEWLNNAKKEKEIKK